MRLVQTVIPVLEASGVGEARRLAQRGATGAGLNETDTGRVGIIATELANNLVRHAQGGGELLLVARDGTQAPSVEILAIDKGVGMTDVNRCLQDGFSTAGTAGTGLGAVGRLSNEFDLYSSDAGTVIWSRVVPSSEMLKRESHAWGVISVPAPRETVCGDACCIAVESGRMATMIADGLGHGPAAAQAAEEACKVFHQAPFRGTVPLLEAAHDALGSTRGAAMAVATVDPIEGKLRYGGVGNIAGTLLNSGGQESRGLFSHNGTLGHQLRKVQEFEYPWEATSILVLHSDGLQTRWSLEKYPGLWRRHPAVIAGVLYRDFRRGRDDVTVAVLAPFAGTGKP